MDDKIRKYTFGGVRIYVVNIKKTAEDTRFAHDLDEDMTNHTAIAEVIAACLCANRKEDNASTALSLKYPEKETAYTAIAENDGKVRGYAEPYTPGIIKQGVIVEVTQRLTIRGDYKSVVAANDLQGAIDEYFKRSQQSQSFCTAKKFSDCFACVLMEQFPITKPEDEIYRNAAEIEWEYLSEIFSLDKFEDAEKYLSKYNLLETVDIKYGCTCSRRKVKETLYSIPKEELAGSIDEDGLIEVKCKFCGKTYKIDPETL